jgi:hypothetical protein
VRASLSQKRADGRAGGPFGGSGPEKSTLGLQGGVSLYCLASMTQIPVRVISRWSMMALVPGMRRFVEHRDVLEQQGVEGSTQSLLTDGNMLPRRAQVEHRCPRPLQLVAAAATAPVSSLDGTRAGRSGLNPTVSGRPSR